MIMFHCIQNLQYFTAFEVLEPRWCILVKVLVCFLDLEHNLHSINTTTDDVLAAHTTFLDHCLKDCMLSNKGAIDRIHDLLILCMGFAQQVQQVMYMLSLHATTTAVVGKKDM